jgi:hypothetical protein
VPAVRCTLALLLLCGGLTSGTPVRAQVPMPEMGPRFGADAASLSQDVVVSVAEINALSVSAGALTLTVSTAAPGQAPDAATHTSTTYSLTTNGTGMKLTGGLSATYAAGVSVTLSLAAPPGASAIPRTLGVVTQDLVTNITRVRATDLTLTYTASATLAAAPNAGGETRTVTLTLTDM